jgi:hypothetical protein
MIRKLTFLGLSLIAVTAIAAGGRAILVDDFNDGDAEGWKEADFTGGRGLFRVRRGAYHLKTTEPIPVDDPSLGTLDADWEFSEDEPLFANGTMRGLIRANTDGTTVGFSLRENHEFETAYGFWGSTSYGTFYIDRFELFNPDGPQTILAMADPLEFPFEVGQTYVLEARVVGDKLTLKAWPVGEREPKRPILKVHDDVLGPDSGSGIAALAYFDPAPLMIDGVTEVNVHGVVDDIYFTPARDRRDGPGPGHGHPKDRPPHRPR